MSVPQLIDTILINPTVNISPSYRDTGARAVAARGACCCPACRQLLLAQAPAGPRAPWSHSGTPVNPPTCPSAPAAAGLNATYSFQPLSNLVYTRDQQVGRRGGPCIMQPIRGAQPIDHQPLGVITAHAAAHVQVSCGAS